MIFSETIFKPFQFQDFHNLFVAGTARACMGQAPSREVLFQRLSFSTRTSPHTLTISDSMHILPNSNTHLT